MNTILGSGLLWWISVIDIPAMSGLLWLVIRTRQEHSRSIQNIQNDFSLFRLEVAKNYASIGEMKDLETRIVSHLLRIESKLDKTALKTASLTTLKDRNHDT